MTKIPIKQCPEQPDYRFKTHCTISTCKFYTERTKNKCMAIDTVFSSSKKGITDAELCVFKFPEYDKKTVFSIRKSAQERVRAMLVLYHFAKHCRDTKKKNEGFRFVLGANPLVDRLVKSKIFRLRLLGLRPWMLKFLFDEKFMSEVSSVEVNFHPLFKLKAKELEEIKNHVKENS